jgi:ABC-type nitrate/sulfonate/bicarbonate transport system substrate-binding protein
VRNYIRGAIGALLALAAIGLTACASQPSSSSPAAMGKLSPASPAKITVVAEWSFWAAHAPVIAAIQNGYYNKLGLDVNFIAPAATGDQVKYLLGGRAQIVLTQPMDVVLSRAKGINIKMIGALFKSNPNGLLVNPSSGATADAATLAGKTVGDTNTPDSAGTIATIEKSARISVNPVSVGQSGLPALMRGKIDALYALYCGERAVVKTLTGKSWPFIKASAVGVPDYPLLVWTTTDSYASSHPAVIKAFLRGTVEGAQRIKADPAAYQQAIGYIKAQNKVYTPAEHEAMAAATGPFLSLNARISPAIITAMVKWMKGIQVNGGPWLALSEPTASYLDSATTSGVAP